MYIRRKVFSVGLDEAGEERLFSTNEFINDERLFSAEGEELVEVVDENGMKKYVPAAAIGTSALAAGAGAAYLATPERINSLADHVKRSKYVDGGFLNKAGNFVRGRGYVTDRGVRVDKAAKFLKTKGGRAAVGAGAAALAASAGYGAYKAGQRYLGE